MSVKYNDNETTVTKIKAALEKTGAIARAVLRKRKIQNVCARSSVIRSRREFPEPAIAGYTVLSRRMIQVTIAEYERRMINTNIRLIDGCKRENMPDSALVVFRGEKAIPISYTSCPRVSPVDKLIYVCEIQFVKTGMYEFGSIKLLEPAGGKDDYED